MVEAEEPVKIHVGRSFQEVLLQRVLEVVDCFGGILKQFVVEDFLAHVSISDESAFEERSSFGCFDCGECCPIIYEFFIPEPADFSVAQCLAAIDKFSVSSVKPVDRPALE